jgi:hypothetical protein
MRSVVPVAMFAVVMVFSSSQQARAGIDAKAPDAASIAALEAKANLAGPREQCFLYAELVHEMIEYSSAEYASGQFEKSADTLKRVNGFARKIHLAMSNDEKRLKNAQILLRHTAFRLNELLHSSSLEDRPLMEQTLAEVNQVQTF